MIRLLPSLFLLSLTVIGLGSCAGPQSEVSESAAAAKPVATPVKPPERDSGGDDYWKLAMQRYQPPATGTGLQPAAVDVETPVTGPSLSDASPTMDSASTKAVSTAPAPKPDLNQAEIPFATWAPGKRGMVTSPFDPNKQPIDVRDFNAGQLARCPYSGKIFRVPPLK